ncbi:MAG: alpha/beta hydrolase [Chloroflexi bacterium]|nr:alpha/beta hydrolase [Chloroflexota bacterium]
MLNEIVSFPASDGYLLDALLYEPAERGAVALVLSHGRAMDFTIGMSRFLPPALVPRGYTCLSINRRGAGVVSMGDKHGPRGGAAYEVAEDSQKDLGGAVACLRERGYERIGLIGHSYGSMASNWYAADHPEIGALVLLSGAVGGEHHIRQLCERGMFARDRYDEAATEARRWIAEGRGDELMFFPGWFYLSTARGFVEHGTPLAVENLKRVRCPVLAVRGERESATNYPVERYAEIAPRGSAWAIIPDSDHFYGGQRDLVCQLVGDFLEQHLPAR